MSPTNNYFNNFPDYITGEQLLIEDLVIESIKQYGMNVYYIPRESRDQIDFLYGEETIKKFTHAYFIEMYLENALGMEGQGDMISKFGLDIQDEITLLVARRRFKNTIPSNLANRPREGDLIYVPLVQNFFEITFVEHENDQAMMYTLGRGRGANVYLFALKMKQFVFSEEKVDTGVEEIDEQLFDSYRRTTLIMSSGNGINFVPLESVCQGIISACTSVPIQVNSSGVVHTWDPATYTLTINQTIGDFKFGGGSIKGNTSGAIWTLSTENTLDNYNIAFEDIVDNHRIQDEASAILNFSELNPFGNP